MASSPACLAASSVSSRAASSNEAGTVRTTSWCSSRRVGSSWANWAFQASRMWREVVGRRLDRRDLPRPRAGCPRAGSSPRGRRRGGRASSWRWRRGGPGPCAPWIRANSPTIRSASSFQGSRAAPGGRSCGARQVEERRQHRPGGRLAGRDELRDLEEPDVGRRPLPALRVDVRHRAVGRPQVDPHDISRACHAVPIPRSPNRSNSPHLKRWGHVRQITETRPAPGPRGFHSP